jgi:DNA-binding MarR family transcriptional regulator
MENVVRLDLSQLNQVGMLCTCFNLRKASRVVTQFFDQMLEPSGLLVTQFTILVAIALSGSGSINELAQGLAMDRTTLTRNLKPLERQGLVQIESGQDRRTRIVRLTDAGQTALTTALPLWQQAQACIVEQLGQTRWSVLLSHLNETTALVRQL